MRNDKLHLRNKQVGLLFKTIQAFAKQKQGKMVMNYVSHIQDRKDDENSTTNNRVKFKLIKRGSTMLNEIPDKTNINPGMHIHIFK